MTTEVPPEPRFRIGELSRRTRVSVELLRAWETRYRLLHPQRTPGGFRLYSQLDESRVLRMQALLGEGLSASQAAAGVLKEEGPTGRATAVPAAILSRLDAAVLAFDEVGAHAALDRLFATIELEVALQGAILPELRSIGERWAAGTVTVAQEHFAANLIRGRLLALARGWDRGRGSRAVVAAAPGELHDIGLIAFGLALHRRGWRIVYLGQDTPLATAAVTVSRAHADALVIGAVDPRRFRGIEDGVRAIARSAVVAIGGRGASASGARRMGATLLGPDLVAGATQLSSLTDRRNGRRRSSDDGDRRTAAAAGGRESEQR